MRELELRCDGIAVLTLRRLGLDPEWLVSAAKKMTRYNEWRGATASASNYSTLTERVSFIRAVDALLSTGEGTVPVVCSRQVQ